MRYPDHWKGLATMSISRRRFLEGTTLGGLAAGVSSASKLDKDKLPTRALGKTGVHVSILAFGGGSRFLMYKDEDKALEAVNRALDLGITYMDTAYSYGNGLSEERIGKVMKTRRKGIFVATKINKRPGDEAMQVLEGSLKRLQIDQFDLVHIHSLTDDKDLADIEAKGGVLETLHKLRDQKVTRFIGITQPCWPRPSSGMISIAPRWR
jgi:aryl-alcohol dehydrogenase-like predicted oxidoreductase